MILLPMIAGPRRAPMIPHHVPNRVFRVNSPKTLVMQPKHKLPEKVLSFLSKK